MGININTVSELPKKGLFKRVIKTSELFENLTNEIKSLLPFEFQKTIFRTAINDNQLFLKLHPAAEYLTFETKDNAVICDAKTNTVGPGYYAFLVELLDRVGNKLNLNWQWDNETDYLETKDYDRLQEEMLKWLHAAAKQLTSNENYNRVMLSMPLDYCVIDDYFVISPMGYWSKTWIQEVANLNPTELKQKGAEFFPWWEKGLGADFWFKSGLTTAWVDLPWHPALNESETDQYQFVLTCFEKAKKLAPNIDLPNKEIEEIRNYMRTDIQFPAPESTGIGFKKRIMERELMGGWRVKIPGFFYDDVEDDGKTAVLWFADRRIHGSAMAMKRKDGNPSLPEALIGNIPQEPGVVDFADAIRKGWAQIEKVNTADMDCWCLHGKMAVSSKICFVTIIFNNEADKNWAIETWKSLQAKPG